MPPMSCGHPKLLLANLLESSGALVFMGEVRSLLRDFLTSPLETVFLAI